MAQKVSVILVDDLDGSEADETIKFALDGVEYEIDLTEGNADDLRKSFETWVQHGRRIGGSRRSPAQTKTRRGQSGNTSELTKEEKNSVRVWGRENGFSVADRGRIAESIVMAWHEAGAPTS